MKMSNLVEIQKHTVILFKGLREDGSAAFLREQCSADYAASVFVCVFPGFQHRPPQNN